MICVNCGKTIEKGYYYNNEHFAYCEECGDELLIYKDELNGYIFLEDNRLFFIDEDLDDIYIFTKKEKE